jgi:hypothetical protein
MSRRGVHFSYPYGHRDVAPLCGLATSCPGEPLYTRVGDGSLEP